MKKLDVKSILLGFIIGLSTITTVSATTSNIKSAKINNTKVIYNGEELQLSQPMITIINEGSQNGSNYMPVRTILEELGYEVGWDNQNNAVLINNKTEGGELILDENIIPIETENVLNQYLSFLNNFDIKIFNSNNVFSWEYFYNGNLTIEEFKIFINENDDLEAMVKDIFTILIKDVDKGMLCIYYDANRYNTLISAVYSKQDNKIIYDFSGIKLNQ